MIFVSTNDVIDDKQFLFIGFSQETTTLPRYMRLLKWHIREVYELIIGFS